MPAPRSGRCLCGLLVRYHFTSRNAKLTCAETRLRRPRAKAAPNSLRRMLFASGATLTKGGAR